MKTALITGVTGQDGSYLAEMLLDKGYKVYGLNRRRAVGGFDNIAHLLDNKNFQIIEGDLIEESRIFEIMRQIRPDEVYNLASQSFVPYSWKSPVYTTAINAMGVMKILEAIRVYSEDSKFYQASTCEMFGKALGTTSQNELTYHYPLSPYACAKSFGFNITRTYRESYGLFASNGIAFNHESERRGLLFVTRKITRKVAEIKFGLDDKIVLGNLDGRRDWGYAPDFVKAMWMILQYKEPDDWIIGTGEVHTVREFVEKAFKEIGINIHWIGAGINEKGIDDNGNIRVEVSKELFRPAETDVIKADISKIKEKIGWKPSVSFEQLVSIMVNADIKNVENSLK